MAKGVPLSRLGDDDDLKGTTLLFASEAGKHVTGATLLLNEHNACVVILQYQV